MHSGKTCYTFATLATVLVIGGCSPPEPAEPDIPDTPSSEASPDDSLDLDPNQILYGIGKVPIDIADELRANDKAPQYGAFFLGVTQKPSG